MSARLIKALENVQKLPQITLGNIADQVEKEGILILCLVSILPFMQPIPIPGVSTILGMIVLFQGIGLMISGKPLMTKKMNQLAITHERFEIIMRAAHKFSGITTKMSAFKHPVTQSKASHIICGVGIVISALFLSLPLPIPFSNLVPAMSIFFICIGLLEDDVFLIFLGFGITSSVMWMAMFSYHFLADQFFNWFS